MFPSLSEYNYLNILSLTYSFSKRASDIILCCSILLNSLNSQNPVSKLIALKLYCSNLIAYPIGEISWENEKFIYE